MKIEPELSAYIETALEKMSHPVSNEIGVECPWCHNRVAFPLIARERDVEAFQSLLEMAEKYLFDNGGTEKMLNELMKRLDERLNIQ